LRISVWMSTPILSSDPVVGRCASQYEVRRRYLALSYPGAAVDAQGVSVSLRLSAFTPLNTLNAQTRTEA
jgi:hypothetical protein